MRRMNRGRSPSPEPLDFFIWTVEDVGLWLEEINLGGYRQVFKENGVNGEYLESMSTFTTEQILRFIRCCHMKWGDFITLCKELRRIKGCSLTYAFITSFVVRAHLLIPDGMCSGMSEGGTEGASALVGSVLLLTGLHKCSEAQQTIESRLAEAGTMKLTYPPETVIRECYFHPKQEQAKNRRLV